MRILILFLLKLGNTFKAVGSFQVLSISRSVCFLFCQAQGATKGGEKVYCEAWVTGSFVS